MTGEEMERAIEFLLQSQANSEARQAATGSQLAETNRQLAETNNQLAETIRHVAENNVQIMHLGKQVEALADSQNDLTLIMTRYVEAQDSINISVQKSIRDLATSVQDLASTVERFIKGRGSNGNS